MRLTSVWLHGFKSFVQRTTLEFGPGITAIVGPNGSGKSNVVDAVRWVLGEQNLRNLRGRRTDDILFSGGAKRAPAGMAEVGLTLDLGDHRLDLPYREIALVRRAYRSGENELYLNRDRARFRDVADLLARLGLGAESLAVVGQGAVDAALSLRAEDRRALLEHAAAIGHLPGRLAEAEDRLRQTEQNLARVGDLVAELTPRLRSLERQARQARERQKLQAELVQGLVRWYAHRWDIPRSRRAETAAAGAAAHRRRCEATDQRIVVQRELAGGRRQLAEQDAEIAAQSDRLSALTNELAILDQTRAVELERQEELAGRCHEGAATVERLDAELREITAAVGVLAAERDDLARHLAGQESDLAEAERGLADWQNQRAERRSRLDAARTGLAAAESTRATALVDRRAVQEQIAQAEAALASREGEVVALAGEETAAEARATEAGENVAALRTVAAELQERCQVLSDQVATARARRSRRSGELSALDREVQVHRARVEAIQALDAAGTGYYVGVRTVLHAANGHGAFHLDGIVGVVAKLVATPARTELAIETALGSHAQDVVVERWVDAETAIAELKRRDAGRATFLPLDALRASRPADVPAGPGVVGIAAGLVDVDARCRVVGDFLLGHTLVVEDLAVARAVRGRCPAHWQIVTLEGDLVRPSGVVTGGSAAPTRGALARFRELREARAALDRHRVEADRLRREVASEQTEVARLEADHGHWSRVEQAAEDDLRQVNARAAEAQRRLEHCQQRRAWLAEEVRRLAERRDAAHQAADHLTTALARAESDWAAAGAAVKTAEGGLARLEQDLGEQAADLLRKKADFELASQRLSALTAALDRMTDQARRTADELARERGHLAALRDRAEALSSQQRAVATRRTYLVAGRAGAIERLALLRAARGETERCVERTARELCRLEEVERDANGEIQTAERALERADLELDGLRAQVVLELGDLDDRALADGCLRCRVDGLVVEAPIAAHPDPDQLRSRLETMRARLRALPAGAEVVGECEATRARLAFLNDQSADLQRSAETLRGTISETREIMKTRFAETFEVVNDAFGRRFGALFGGGSARLMLDGDADGGGVEVLAQPPGKRTESLAALSGGERALTAAALLFALIEANPPPFCVLDEVDAALDESNVARFCDALVELSRQTQFVVVTHNRRTMEAASAIYGLTLEQRSETRVLSLRLPGAP